VSEDDFYNELKLRHGLTKMNDAQGDNVICCDVNQTHFEIPDPSKMPDASREAMFEFISGRLNVYSLGY